MTVKVSKPAFNLREKLSELDRPVGTHGSQLMQSADAAESFDLVKAGRKNLIINGEHKIWQRGTSTASPAGTGLVFGPDRWMFEEGCGELVATISRSTSTPTGEGFQYSAKINVDTAESAISGDFAQYMYFVEGYDFASLKWGTAHAKPVTLSFWFRTTISGDHYVTFNSNSGTDTWSTVIHSPSNIWKKHVVTVNPPVSGTWNTTNGRGLEIRIGLCNSSSVAVSDWGKWYHGGGGYNGFATAYSDLILTQNNKAYLTGVQLEEGTVATSFEHRSYGEELALCHRYYQFIDGTSDQITFGPGRTNGTTIAEVTIPLTVPLAKSPTITCPQNGCWDVDGGHTSTATPGVRLWNKDSSSLAVAFGSHSGLTNGRPCVVTSSNNSDFIMSAEL